MNNIKIVKHETMTIYLDAVLKNKECPSPSKDNYNWAYFEPINSNEYDLQFFINEYFLNNAIWAAFYADMLNFTAPIPTDIVTTTTINAALFGELKEHGFADD